MFCECILCLRKDEDTYLNPFSEPFFEGLSLVDIVNSISNLKVGEKNCGSQRICQDCTYTILNFYRLIQAYKNRENKLKTELEKKDELVFLDEKDYDNYVECETESYRDTEEQNDCDKNELEWPKQEDDKDKEFSESCQGTDEKTKPRIFDDMGNEEISSRKYTCDECGDSFLFKVGFSLHMVQKHNIYLENHMYDLYSTHITVKIPPVTGNTVNFVRKHPSKKLVHRVNETDFRCQICKQILPSAEELKEHYNCHKNHVCEYCGAAFIKNSYLRDHLLVHTTVKRYTCDICGKKFKYRNGLTVHKNIHVNFRGFMCDTCGQGFNAKSTLKTHIKLKHTDERNFQCPECDLSFKVKSWLDKHYSRKHTLNRTKDFVCNLCGIAYLNKTTLTRHISEKHTGTPVRHYCTVCEKSYTMKTKLNMHMQKKHNIILNNSSSQLIL